MSDMRAKLLNDYKILLAIGWLQAGDDDYVSYVMGEEVRPATINGKRVFLPTREQMKNTNWTDRIGFHPLRESYNLGVSDVLANLRDQYVFRLNTSISYFMKEMIDLAFDLNNQKNLTTEQAQVLNALKNVTAQTVAAFGDLLKKTKSRNDADQFINLFIRRGGVIKGQSYPRAAIVSFPIYKHLVDGTEKINGVKFSAKDREQLIKLFEFIFPTITDSESFNVGISSKTAPFLESLVRSTFNVVDQFVESTQPYKTIVAAPFFLEFPEDMGKWNEIFDSKDLAEKLQRSIPNMSEGEEEEVKPADVYKGVSGEVIAVDNRPARERQRDPVVGLEPERPAAPVVPPRGRLTLGDSPKTAAPSGEGLGKSQPDQERASPSDRAPTRTLGGGGSTQRQVELDRENERIAREKADRERRERDREEREERDRRERERRERYDREERDRDRDRDGRRDERDYDDRDRRDREPPPRSDDPFENNPILRANMRSARYDEDDRGGRGRRDLRDGRDYDRGGRYDERDRYDDRGRYDERDRYDDRGRGRGGRDLRDGRGYDSRDNRSRYTRR